MATLYEVFQPTQQLPAQQKVGGYGPAWGAAFGHVKDQLMSWSKLAVLARFPTFAPVDALGKIGLERGITQGPLESIYPWMGGVGYINRLLNAWGAWTLGGTYWGLLAELNGAGYSTAYIVGTNGLIYGPSSGVAVPDPINGVAGTPPAFTPLPPWYAFGSADVGNEWAATTVYALNAIVTPVAHPGTWFIATQSGTSGGSEPTWPGLGGSVVDGSVTWTYGGDYTAQPVFPPWNFNTTNGQGQPQDNIDIPVNNPAPPVPQGQSYGGPPDPEGRFWSRFVVIFDPVPGSWNSLQNPPTVSSAPSSTELAIITSIINTWKPARSLCVGIGAIGAGGNRGMWAFPLSTTTNIPVSCWLANAITGGDVPVAGAFDPLHPQQVGSWLPNVAIANAGSSTYMFTIPSAAYLAANPGGGFLFSSPASSGTTGFVEPTWPASIGGTVTDNGITWTACASLEAFGDGSFSTVFETITS